MARLIAGLCLKACWQHDVCAVNELKTEFKFVEKQPPDSHHSFNTSTINHGLSLKKLPTITLRSQLIALQGFREATMLKSFFSKSTTEDQALQSLEISNVVLMSRVVQIIQRTARNQEKYSTLVSLRPLNN
jgi:hypothetical protein